MPELQTVLFFGGSQGARAINLALSQGLAILLGDRRIQVLWVSGHLDFESASASARPFGQQVIVRPFIDDMAAAYAAADLAVTRAGALTISELPLFGLPTIFVPLPTAAADHQTRNALALVNSGAAEMILQRDLDGARLAAAVAGLMDDPLRRREMSARMRALCLPDAAVRIVDALQRAGLLEGRA